MKNKIFIFDFDSTFIQVESLSTLAEVALAKHPHKAKIIADIDNITEQTMSGLYSFAESLKQRLQLLTLHRTHIDQSIALLKKKITPSILKHQAFFKANHKNIFIISGGFYEIIQPLVADFGIAPDHIFANHFYYDYDGQVVDIDQNNPLAQDQGKIKQMQLLNFPSEQTIIIGDGFNDYEIKEAGFASTFYAFAENVQREAVLKEADAVIKDLDGLFLLANLDYQPKTNQKNVLLLENIHPTVSQYFLSKGYSVETRPKALSEEDLLDALKNVHILGIRSKTKISEAIIKQAPNLEAIGAFCIGTNQIDLHAAINKGIAVFNAPFSNTRSVVELTLAQAILLMRNAVSVNRKLNQGTWYKSSQGANEVRGKTLGIIGYGNIGSQLSILAEAIGMNVMFYDIEDKLPLGNASVSSSMQEVLKQADIISIHVDGRSENKHLIGPTEFEQMKQDAVFLNLSRDFVVDQKALVAALRSKHIKGAGVDVFPNEPNQSGESFTSDLLQFENVFLTPHIGGSTQEAQKHIGEYVSRHLHGYCTYGSSIGSVNFPQISLPAIETQHRVIHIHKNRPGVLAEINRCLASEKSNIEGQFLKTNEAIGYVITDIDHSIQDSLIDSMKNIEHTIRVRKF